MSKIYGKQVMSRLETDVALLESALRLGKITPKEVADNKTPFEVYEALGLWEQHSGNTLWAVRLGALQTIGWDKMSPNPAVVKLKE